MSFKPVTVSPPSRAVSTGRVIRKVALLGSHSESLQWCPWDDLSWELWGHAASRVWYRRQPDRYFDLHRKECWTAGRKGETYLAWLGQNTVPIFMQEKHRKVPASRRYPVERVLMEYGGARRYFKNQLAWMIALAFTEGVTQIGLFGINYGAETEYGLQRGSAEYWLGRAEERGVHLVLPPGCTLLSEPVGLYGYESHDETGMLLPAFKHKKYKPAETISPEKRPRPAEPPAWLLPQIQAEEAMRPEWARVPSRTDGGLA